MAGSRAASAAHEEATLQARSTGRRIYQLDALRGLAAVVVVAHHTRLVEHGLIPPWYLAPLFAGPEAVSLFFVLSGFVLSLPLPARAFSALQHLRGSSNHPHLHPLRRGSRIFHSGFGTIPRVPPAIKPLVSAPMELPCHLARCFEADADVADRLLQYGALVALV